MSNSEWHDDQAAGERALRDVAIARGDGPESVLRAVAVLCHAVGLSRATEDSPIGWRNHYDARGGSDSRQYCEQLVALGLFERVSDDGLYRATERGLAYVRSL